MLILCLLAARGEDRLGGPQVAVVAAVKCQIREAWKALRRAVSNLHDFGNAVYNRHERAGMELDYPTRLVGG